MKFKNILERLRKKADAGEPEQSFDLVPDEKIKRLILTNEADSGIRAASLCFYNESQPINLPTGLIAHRLTVSNCPSFTALPDNLVANIVKIFNCQSFSEIPSSIWATELSIDGCPNLSGLPSGLRIGRLNIQDCPSLTSLSGRIIVDDLTAQQSRIERLDEHVIVHHNLDLTDSPRLTEVLNAPTDRRSGLNLRRCTGLKRIPDRIECDYLDMAGCMEFQWPEFALIEVNYLNISDCAQINDLPGWLTVRNFLDIANTGITHLPKWLKSCRLMWRGVEIDERIAFHPESITPDEVLNELNVEVRRVMLERIGWERFLSEVDYKVIDEDQDRGGLRQLLEFGFEDDDDLRILSVICPSTQKRFFIRVPPYVTTCSVAAAWIAGFDPPDQYKPVIET